MISKRIKELAAMIPETKRVIDVGCDHALLDITLASKFKNTSFLATDISSNAIKESLKRVKKEKLDDRITLLVNDGLKGISLNRDDFIVISGMGTNTIIDIIESRINEINKILIQSNRDLELLRKFMFDHGFKISDEKVIYDNHFYIFIYFERGEVNYNLEDLWLGPVIKDSNYHEYFLFLLEKYKKILPGIPDNDLKTNLHKKIDFLEDLIEKR